MSVCVSHTCPRAWGQTAELAAWLGEMQDYAEYHEVLSTYGQ